MEFMCYCRQTHIPIMNIKGCCVHVESLHIHPCTHMHRWRKMILSKGVIARALYSTCSSACARSHQHGGSGEELIHTLTSWTLLLSVVWKSASIASTLLAGTPRYRPSWYRRRTTCSREWRTEVESRGKMKVSFQTVKLRCLPRFYVLGS